MRNFIKAHRKYLLRITIIFIAYILFLNVPLYFRGLFRIFGNISAQPLEAIIFFNIYLATLVDLPACNMYIHYGWMNPGIHWCGDWSYGWGSPFLLISYLIVVLLQTVILERIGMLVIKFIKGRLYHG